jgi:YfiH family protein
MLNRQEAAAALGVKNGTVFVMADQTHSDYVYVVSDRLSRGWREQESAVAECDALVTAQTGVVLGILTADCVPVLLYDPCREVVAAVHAGWRGTKANIVAKTVKKMQEVFGCDPSQIMAGIGPSIGKCCYEVGREVAGHFSHIAGACEEKESGKYQLDLQHINKYQLLKAGVCSTHIELSGICTACSTEAFFSYRKEQGCSGRFMSMIGILPLP